MTKTKTTEKTEAGVVEAAPAAQLPAVAEQKAPPPPTIDQQAPQTGILPVTGVASLATAISAITAEIAESPVHKGGTNSFHNYSYARMQDILVKLTPMLAKAGIVIMQSETARGFMDNGNAIYVEYEFTIVHKSGEVWPQKLHQTGVCNARATNGKFDDKALNKCHTAARKYMLLSLFQIPTSDEDDADHGANDGPPPRRAQQQERRPDVQREPPKAEWKAPYTIATEGRTFAVVAGEYIAQIKLAKTPEELVEWADKNSVALNIMANNQQAAAIYAKVQAASSERAEELAARA